MEMTVLVRLAGQEILRVRCQGTRVDCTHEVSGPGAEDFRALLGQVPAHAQAGGLTSSVSSPRFFMVLAATAQVAFPSEDGYELELL